MNLYNRFQGKKRNSIQVQVQAMLALYRQYAKTRNRPEQAQQRFGNNTDYNRKHKKHGITEFLIGLKQEVDETKKINSFIFL